MYLIKDQKATKFYLTLLSKLKQIWEIFFQIFMTFLEYLNFEKDFKCVVIAESTFQDWFQILFWK